MPDNKHWVAKRLESLRRRLLRDEKYHNDYRRFFEDIIGRGDAEEVPPEDLHKEGAWYIPHHGVYHPKKPEKIRVVFDCSARFFGTSLNDHLLQGPDLMNSLAGILCRFRQKPVAFMCDIEKMFHQFRVNVDD